MSTRPSNRYSMEGAVGDLVVHHAQKKKRIWDGSSVLSRPSPNVVLISMPLVQPQVLGCMLARWYRLTIHTDGEEGSILPVWSGIPPVLGQESSYAVLGSNLYCVGGKSPSYTFQPPPLSDVFVLDINNKIHRTPGSEKWIRVESMISPRRQPQCLVLGGKLYALGGDRPYRSRSRSHSTPTTFRAGEVFDPMTGLWEALPDAPCHIEPDMFCAALENPNRILVVSRPEEEEEVVSHTRARTRAKFLTYDVQNRSWKLLQPARGKIHGLCPSDKAFAVVGNILYWMTDLAELVAYDLDLDLWRIGFLKGLGISFLEDFFEPNTPVTPVLIHLEDQRFCVMQTTSTRPRHPRHRHCHIECVLFDVSPMPKKKKNLRISIVSTIKYNTHRPTCIEDYLSLGKLK